MPPPQTSASLNLLRQLALSTGKPVRPNPPPCLRCRPTIFPHRTPTARAFSTTLPAHKKSSASSKSSKKSPEVETPKKGKHVPDNAATRERDAEIDPYDFSALESAIAKAVARLKDSLAKTRDAGRVTPEMVEALNVEINVKPEHGGGGSGEGAKHAHKESVKVGDIASVVPKGGRTMQVFCAEESHVKPITSAILSSPHSLVPQADAHNPLLLLIPVPPATAETRKLAAAEAKKVFDRASQDVRNARGDAQKRHRKMELEKLVVKDELRKAHKEMEEVAKKGQEECHKVYEGALKALQQ